MLAHVGTEVKINDKLNISYNKLILHWMHLYGLLFHDINTFTFKFMINDRDIAVVKVSDLLIGSN